MDNQANLINLEILRMAKELVTNEYMDRRAQLHNQWLKDSEEQYLLFGKQPSYPDIPPYPTEQDVVTRAQSLLNFLLDNHDKVSTAASTVDQSTMAIGKIQEPAAVAPMGPELPSVFSQLTAEVAAANTKVENSCTGPTGNIDNIGEQSCTGPTGTKEPTDQKDSKKLKTRIPLPPDEYLEYARYKAKSRLDEEGSEITKIIPDIIKTITSPKVV